MLVLVLGIMGLVVFGVSGIASGKIILVPSSKRVNPIAQKSMQSIESVVEKKTDKDKFADNWSDLSGYLSDEEIQGFLTIKDQGVRNKQVLLWETDKWDRQDKLLLRADHSTLTPVQGKAKDALQKVLQQENDVVFRDENIARQYSEFVKTIPLLTEDTVDEFNTDLENFSATRLESVQAKARAELKKNKQIKVLRDKFYELNEKYPFQFATWSQAQFFNTAFENGRELNADEVARLNKLVDFTDLHCFIVCEDDLDENLVSLRVKLDPERNQGYRIHMKSYLGDKVKGFYLDDGSISRTIDVDSRYTFEIDTFSSNYNTVLVRKIFDHRQ